MEGQELSELVQQWTNDVLVWIGFGTVVGLLAKAIMPGRDPGGAVATVLMGIGGTVIGCGVFSYAAGGQRVIPISPAGMAVATAGAFLILFFYRLLAGRWGLGEVRPRRRVREPYHARRYHVSHYDED